MSPQSILSWTFIEITRYLLKPENRARHRDPGGRAILFAHGKIYLYDGHVHGPPPVVDARMKFEDSRFVQLGYLLTQDYTRADVRGIFDNITFLTFNYDRCIETFAQLAQGTYEIASSEAAAIAGRLNVLHVYGTIGSPAWTGKPNLVEFGHKHGTDSRAITRDIRTFTETIEFETAALIRNKIAEAETLVFRFRMAASEPRNPWPEITQQQRQTGILHEFRHFGIR